MLPRENLWFLTKNFQNHQNSITWNLVFTLPLRILLKPWTFSFKKDTITAKTVSKLKGLEERKIWDLPRKWRIWSSDTFEDHYVLVFDLTLMQDATENCHYPELVREPLRLVLSFTFPLEHVTELIVMGERMSSVSVDKFGVVRKNI